MKKELINVVGEIFLGICIIIGAIIISYSNNQAEANNPITSNDESRNDEILTLEEAADYLKITPENLEKLIQSNPSELQYVKIEDQYIFTIQHLNYWLEIIKLSI